jgi:hypothetical protein
VRLKRPRLIEGITAGSKANTLGIAPRFQITSPTFGYCSTFCFGKSGTAGGIYQQALIDTYSKVSFAKHYDLESLIKALQERSSRHSE